MKKIFSIIMLSICIITCSSFSIKASDTIFNNCSANFITIDNQLNLSIEIDNNNLVECIDVNYYLFGAQITPTYYALPNSTTNDYVNFKRLKVVDIDNGTYYFETIFEYQDDWFSFDCIVPTNFKSFFNFSTNTNVQVNEILDIYENEIFIYQSEIYCISSYALELEDGGFIGGGGDGNSVYIPSPDSEQYAKDMANKDTYLDSYDLNQNTSLTSDGKYKDDDITKIIPKSYFLNVGTRSIIGSEYGYCIVTTNPQEGLYNSIVILFDIEVILPGFQNSEIDSHDHKTQNCSIYVFPKITCVYQSMTKNYSVYKGNWNSVVYNSTDTVVTKNYVSNHYYITNLKASISIDNKNTDTSQLTIEQDKGDYLTRADYYRCGVLKREVDDSTFQDFVSLGISIYVNRFGNIIVQGVNEAISYIDFMINYFEYVDDVSQNEKIYQVYYENKKIIYDDGLFLNDKNNGHIYLQLDASKIEQAINPGYLVRNILLCDRDEDYSYANSDDYNPVLYGVGNTAIFQYTLESENQNEQEESNIELYLYADFFVEQISSNGSHLGFYKYSSKGDIIEDTCFRRDFKYLTNEVPVNVEIETSGEFDYYKFSCTQTGYYTISTQGSYNTKMIAYNDYCDQIASSSGTSSNGNATICLNMQAGKVYYFKVGMNNSNTGNFQMMIRRN